jgi:hypothetical protein
MPVKIRTYSKDSVEEIFIIQGKDLEFQFLQSLVVF